MVRKVKIEAVYIDQDELFSDYKDTSVENINIPMIKDRELIKKSSLVIFSKSGQYKVLKSRY